MTDERLAEIRERHADVDDLRKRDYMLGGELRDQLEEAEYALESHAFEDVADLLAEVERLRKYVPSQVRFEDLPPGKLKHICCECDEPATRWVRSTWEEQRTGVPFQFLGWCEEHWPGPKNVEF